MHDVEADWFFGLVGLVALVLTIQALKRGRMVMPTRGGRLFVQRKTNPVGYWLVVLNYGGVALFSLYLVAKDIWFPQP